MKEKDAIVLKLLKAAGYPATVLNDIEKEDFDVNAVIEENNRKQKEHLTEIVRNEIEAEIRDAVTAERDGYWLNMVNHELKKNGVPLDDIKDKPLHLKLKTFKSVLEQKAANSKNDTSEEIQKLQAEKMELANQITEWERRLEEEVAKVRQEEAAKTTKKLVELELQKKFHSVPADKILGKKHSDGIMLAIKSIHDSRYDFKLDDNGNVIPYEKGTAKRVVAKNAEGREYFVSYEDLILNSLKELNLLVESNGQQQSFKNGEQGSAAAAKSSRLQEMEAKINQG